jgi:hypothetical protein
MTAAGMDTEWQVTAVNRDSQGLEFVSSFEHKRYPLYGVQFHPEKNAYEWKATNNNPHTSNAILVLQYFANFFVDEGKRIVRLFLPYPYSFPLSRTSFIACHFFLVRFLFLPFTLSLVPSFIFFPTKILCACIVRSHFFWCLCRVAQSV